MLHMQMQSTSGGSVFTFKRCVLGLEILPPSHFAIATIVATLCWFLHTARTGYIHTSEEGFFDCLSVRPVVEGPPPPASVQQRYVAATATSVAQRRPPEEVKWGR
eukprot:6466511-Amphidinium_carterae.1